MSPEQTESQRPQSRVHILLMLTGDSDEIFWLWSGTVKGRVSGALLCLPAAALSWWTLPSGSLACSLPCSPHAPGPSQGWVTLPGFLPFSLAGPALAIMSQKSDRFHFRLYMTFPQFFLSSLHLLWPHSSWTWPQAPPPTFRPSQNFSFPAFLVKRPFGLV